MVTIGIDKSAVLQEARRMSEYVGLKSGTYDATRMLKADDPQAELWFADAVGGLLPVLDRVTRGAVSERDGRIEFRLDVGNSARTQLEPLLTRYAVAVLLARWLRLTAPALAEQYAADEQSLLVEIERTAYFREMPS